VFNFAQTRRAALVNFPTLGVASFPHSFQHPAQDPGRKKNRLGFFSKRGRQKAGRTAEEHHWNTDPHGRGAQRPDVQFGSGE
jgi:hypothetical protein